MNPQSVEFSDGRTQEYAVKDIVSFGAIGEDSYQRFTISRHILPANDLDNFPANEDSTVVSTVWLRILLNAQYSLAELTTTERNYYFIIQNGRSEELIFAKGIRSYARDKYLNTTYYGKTLFVETNTFRDQLAKIFEKSNSNTWQTDRLRYSRKDLFDYLIRNQGLSITYTKSSKGHWGLIAGAGLSNFTVAGNNGFTDFGGSVENNTSPFYGVNYTIFSTRNLSRIGIMFDMSVLTLQSNGKTQPFADLVNEVKFKNTYLQLSATPIYIFNPTSSVRFYIGAGVKYLARVSGNNYVVQKNLTSGLSTTIQNEPVFRNIVTAHATTGIIFGKFNCLLGITPYGRLTENSYNRISGSSITAAIVFNLSK